MKKLRLVLGLTALIAFGFNSCKKAETIVENSIESIEGTYVGTLTAVDGLKSGAIITDRGIDAIAEVTDLGDGQVKIHCFGGEMDTTFMLNHFENNDSIMVCLNGQAFENMYGHSTGCGSHNGSGGMMGNGSGLMGGASEWMDHMNNEHDESDEHFGGFDMTNSTFGYTIKHNNGYFHFQGTKK